MKIRVLVVDDAVVVRRLVSEVLASDADIEVAGTAANGKIALAKIPQVNPDLVTMDIEMPDMNGLETVKEIRKLYPKLPVIMFSTLTSRGAVAALDALAAGANDYVTKPANVGSISAGMARIREELIPKIKALCGHKSTLPQPQAPATASPIYTPPAIAANAIAARVEMVVIGVSTGGPNALAVVIPGLPAELQVPVLIVQHMPPVFTRVLAERLNQTSKVSVKEAEQGEEILPGTVYIAPGDFHMRIERKMLRRKITLNQETPENSCRPAADVLFRSAAEVVGAGTLGVVLTGMGQDGFRGAQAIRQAGGRIIAQDEKSSVVWGMPGFIARGGLADRLYPIDEVAKAIAHRTSNR